MRTNDVFMPMKGFLRAKEAMQAIASCHKVSREDVLSMIGGGASAQPVEGGSNLLLLLWKALQSVLVICRCSVPEKPNEERGR